MAHTRRMLRRRWWRRGWRAIMLLRLLLRRLAVRRLRIGGWHSTRMWVGAAVGVIVWHRVCRMLVRLLHSAVESAGLSKGTWWRWRRRRWWWDRVIVAVRWHAVHLLIILRSSVCHRHCWICVIECHRALLADKPRQPLPDVCGLNDDERQCGHEKKRVRIMQRTKSRRIGASSRDRAARCCFVAVSASFHARPSNHARLQSWLLLCVLRLDTVT